MPIESNPELDMNASITREEVVKAMNAMKNNKSAGIDNLLADVIKYGTPQLAPYVEYW